MSERPQSPAFAPDFADKQRDRKREALAIFQNLLECLPPDIANKTDSTNPKDAEDFINRLHTKSSCNNMSSYELMNALNKLPLSSRVKVGKFFIGGNEYLEAVVTDKTQAGKLYQRGMIGDRLSGEGDEWDSKISSLLREHPEIMQLRFPLIDAQFFLKTLSQFPDQLWTNALLFVMHGADETLTPHQLASKLIINIRGFELQTPADVKILGDLFTALSGLLDSTSSDHSWLLSFFSWEELPASLQEFLSKKSGSSPKGISPVFLSRMRNVWKEIGLQPPINRKLFLGQRNISSPQDWSDHLQRFMEITDEAISPAEAIRAWKAYTSHSDETCNAGLWPCALLFQHNGTLAETLLSLGKETLRRSPIGFHCEWAEHILEKKYSNDEQGQTVKGILTASVPPEIRWGIINQMPQLNFHIRRDSDEALEILQEDMKAAMKREPSEDRTADALQMSLSLRYLAETNQQAAISAFKKLAGLIVSKGKPRKLAEIDVSARSTLVNTAMEIAYAKLISARGWYGSETGASNARINMGKGWPKKNGGILPMINHLERFTRTSIVRHVPPVLDMKNMMLQCERVMAGSKRGSYRDELLLLGKLSGRMRPKWSSEQDVMPVPAGEQWPETVTLAEVVEGKLECPYLIDNLYSFDPSSCKYIPLKPKTAEAFMQFSRPEKPLKPVTIRYSEVGDACVLAAPPFMAVESVTAEEGCEHLTWEQNASGGVRIHCMGQGNVLIRFKQRPTKKEESTSDDIGRLQKNLLPYSRYMDFPEKLRDEMSNVGDGLNDGTIDPLKAAVILQDTLRRNGVYLRKYGNTPAYQRFLQAMPVAREKTLSPECFDAYLLLAKELGPDHGEEWGGDCKLASHVLCQSIARMVDDCAIAFASGAFVRDGKVQNDLHAFCVMNAMSDGQPRSLILEATAMHTGIEIELPEYDKTDEEETIVPLSQKEIPKPTSPVEAGSIPGPTMKELAAQLAAELGRKVSVEQLENTMAHVRNAEAKILAMPLERHPWELIDALGSLHDPRTREVITQDLSSIPRGERGLLKAISQRAKSAYQKTLKEVDA